MRTTNEIVIAVKECQPVSEEELRLAVASLSSINAFHSMQINKLIEAFGSGSELKLKLRLSALPGHRESMFQGAKAPMDKWLGAENTPGTPENKARLDWAKSVYKKATGEEI